MQQVCCSVLQMTGNMSVPDCVLLAQFERKNKSSVVVLDLNGEKEIKITRQQLTKMANSKMADFFSGHQNELSQWIVKENEYRSAATASSLNLKLLKTKVNGYVFSKRITNVLTLDKRHINDASSNINIPKHYQWIEHYLRK